MFPSDIDADDLSKQTKFSRPKICSYRQDVLSLPSGRHNQKNGRKPVVPTYYIRVLRQPSFHRWQTGFAPYGRKEKTSPFGQRFNNYL